jgi:HAMP domain
VFQISVAVGLVGYVRDREAVGQYFWNQMQVRWIIRPILRLNRASEAMAAGDLDQTV